MSTRDWADDILAAAGVKEVAMSETPDVALESTDWEEYTPGGKTRLIPFSELFWSPTTVDDFLVHQFEGYDNVPNVTGGYIPNKRNVETYVLAIEMDMPAYVHGPTGSGKTLMPEFVAMKTGRPLLRLNHDIDLDRAKFFGKDAIVTDEHGNPSTTYKAGLLPRSAATPTLVLLDEVDKGDPAVLAMYFPILDRREIQIPEMGTTITPCDQWRIVGTGNTCGNGEGVDVYNSCNVQDAAFLNRFSVFLEEDYLDKGHEALLIKSFADSLGIRLTEKQRADLARFSASMHDGFKQRTISSAFSPRNLRDIVKLMSRGFNERKAINVTYMSRLSESEQSFALSVIKAIWA